MESSDRIRNLAVLARISHSSTARRGRAEILVENPKCDCTTAQSWSHFHAQEIVAHLLYIALETTLATVR